MIYFTTHCSSDFIRIKPDWNVKFIEWFIANVAPLIRIKPDWNVKK